MVSLVVFVLVLVLVRVLMRVRGLCGVLDRAPQELHDVAIGQAVKNVFSGASPRDDALGPQDPKLLRHGGEAHPCGGGELRHAPLAVGEAIEELEPRDLTRRSKQRRRALELLFRRATFTRAASMLFGATDAALAFVLDPRRLFSFGFSRHQFTDY